MKKYSKDHEWIELLNGVATVGITAHAQDQLGDIVYVELPAVGRTVTKDEAVATVESTKSVSDVYSPVAGEVSELNDNPVADPSLLNSDPEGLGWLYRLSGVAAADLDDLMDEAAYQQFCN
jgi:glycine cleavage system H protein